MHCGLFYKSFNNFEIWFTEIKKYTPVRSSQKRRYRHQPKENLLRNLEFVSRLYRDISSKRKMSWVKKITGCYFITFKHNARKRTDHSSSMMSIKTHKGKNPSVSRFRFTRILLNPMSLIGLLGSFHQIISFLALRSITTILMNKKLPNDIESMTARKGDIKPQYYKEQDHT